MYKSLLIIISLTLSLTSCYTQFSVANSSSPYIADVQYDNEEDISASADYYDGYYEYDENDTEYNINNYYGSSWYGNYPYYGYYTGWYAPHGHGGLYSGYIYYPSYPIPYYGGNDYASGAVDRNSRSYNKGRSSRAVHTRKRTPRSSSSTVAPSNTAAISGVSSGNVSSTSRGKRKTESLLSKGQSGGGSVAISSNSSHKSKSDNRTIASTSKRSKKRGIRFTPQSSKKKSNKRSSYKSAKKFYTTGGRADRNHKSVPNSRQITKPSSRSSHAASSHRASSVNSRSASSAKVQPAKSSSSRSSSGRSTSSRRRR
jgi:hypothetical protein